LLLRNCDFYSTPCCPSVHTDAVSQSKWVAAVEICCWVRCTIVVFQLLGRLRMDDYMHV
jgi:hypothetical protein